MVALIERPAVKHNTLQLVAEQRKLPGLRYRIHSKYQTARADSVNELTTDNTDVRRYVFLTIA
jgi:hypothetical protein